MYSLGEMRRIEKIREKKRLDDFVIEMITQHYLMEEGTVERVKA
jgi:hypothetical protein